MLASATNTTAQTSQPPYVALRQSVLSLFTNINISTDQGQTIVNDINTQFINNIRLEIEHDEGWMRSDGTMLDYAYDRPNWLPSQNTSVDVQGYTGSNFQTTPNVKAFQGLEAGSLPTPSGPTGAIGGAPLTNDPNQYGNNHLAPLIGAGMGVSQAAALAGAGTQPTLTFAAGSWTGNSGATPTAGYLVFEFDDGRIAYVPFTGGTGVSASGGVLTVALSTGSAAFTLGGINVITTLAQSQATTGVTLTAQALGTTAVLNQPLVGEVVQLPLIFTGAVTTGNFVLTSIGGISLLATSGSATLAPEVYGQLSGLNPNANLGFMDRVTVFQNSAEYQFTPAGTNTPVGKISNPNGCHTYFYRAIVPLKLMHDFFMQLNFPIINIGFNFQFTLAQSNGSTPNTQYPPFQTGNNSYLISNGVNQIGYPNVYYGQESGGQMGTRLYYRVVKFSPADNARVAEKLTTGFTKSVKFISTDWFREPVPVTSGTSNHQFQFSTSVVHPLRVWVLPYPVINYVGGTQGALPVPASTREALQDATFSPGVITGYFNQSNILINNIPYFRQNFITVDDLWEQLREQFDPDNGSMIDYRSFLTYKRGQCYDLTRISDRLQSPTEPVNLVFNANRADGLQCSLQMYYLTERLNQITFRFSSSDVAIVVGNLYG